MESGTKNCPYCGEEIMAAAKKCRHCGKWLCNDSKNVGYKPNPHGFKSYSSDSKKDNATNSKVLRYSIVAFIVIMIGVVISLVLFNKSNDKKELYEPIEEVEEISPDLWGMSCKEACHNNVEWRVKYARGAYVTTLELEAVVKGDNNFYPTNCYLDTYGYYKGITKECASYLYSRFNPTENYEDDYSERFYLLPSDFDSSAQIGYEGY